MLLAYFNAFSQENFVEAEGEMTIKKIPTNNDIYFDTRFTHMFKRHHQTGIYGGISTDGNTTSYYTGLVFEKESFNILRVEASLGPELDQEIRKPHNFSMGILANVCFETKTNKDRASWKCEGSYTLYYSKELGWWHLAQVTLSPVKWLSLGIRDQTYGLRFGGVIRINMPGGIRPFLGFDKNRQQIGIQYSGKLI